MLQLIENYVVAALNVVLKHAHFVIIGIIFVKKKEKIQKLKWKLLQFESSSANVQKQPFLVYNYSF